MHALGAVARIGVLGIPTEKTRGGLLLHADARVATSFVQLFLRMFFLSWVIPGRFS